MNTPQLKGTATEFIEVYKFQDSRLFRGLINPYLKLKGNLQNTVKQHGKTIAVWHITPHPFIDINQFKK